MFSVDVLNSTLVDLLPRYEELFLKKHPLLAYIMKGGKIEKSKLKGPYREFTVVTGGPGRGTGLQTGSETLTSTRRNIGLRGREYAFRYIYHFAIPGKDLDEANGQQDLARLIAAYPDIAVKDALEIFTRQTMRGASSAASDPTGTTDASGFLTLNGNQTYDPQGLGARTGIFQYSTSQTATVHDLPMANAATNPTTGWYHQYAHIGSFSLDGLKQLRILADRASRQGDSLEGKGVDLMLGDEASYHNYIEALDDKVIEVDKINNPAAKFLDSYQGVKCGNADFYCESEIDISDTVAFSGTNPRLGVIFGFNTSKWEIMQVNNSGKGKTNFDIQTPTSPLPDQDAWQWRILAYLNPCCHSLRNQFCMTGGAQT